MKQLFSIVGIDGSGKDYQLERIMAKVDPSVYFSLHCTAYHQAPRCANPILSKTLQKLGLKADRTSDAALKGISLFLKMLLFEKELRHLQEYHNAPIVLSTRHPVIDTPAYARFFVQHMNMTAKDQTHVFTRARSYLTPEEWALVGSLFDPGDERWGGRPLPEFIAQTATLDWAAQFEVYARIFNVPLPEKILFLNPPVDTVADRLQRRAVNIRETHEQTVYLKWLKTYTEQAVDAIKNYYPAIEVCTVDYLISDVDPIPLSLFKSGIA